MQINLLGGCRIVVGTRTVEMRRKPKQLIKLLALQSNYTLHREQIIELLWRDQETEAAINNLHKCVHAARRALEPDLISGGDSRFILTKDGRIILTAPGEVEIDTAEFEKLATVALKDSEENLCEAALAAYAGELLPEDLYEDWTSEQRENLRLTHRRLLDKLGALYEQSGRFEQSADVFQMLVQADELDEAAHRNLMKAFALQGNRARALKQFETCRKLLKKELGVEPEQETHALFEQISSGKFVAPLKSANENPSLQDANQVSTERIKIKTNLPAQLTSFIGREREISEIKSLLENARLLTLTGAGGIGKTRLALETAKGLVDKFSDGVRLIELASLNDSANVARAVCAALGIGEEVPKKSLQQILREFLRDKQILLLLDNCEQIVESCAALAADLLKNCPFLTVLATSREALDTPGEIVWSVSTLSLPPKSNLKTALDDFVDCEAVRLFVARARLVDPHFNISENNAEAIGRLCRKLDGIPLAIELAAARVRAISVEQIVARLDRSLQFLTNGGRTVAPRHQTLRATIDWSYQILSEPEREIWRRLSVFAGGFTLDAAEFVNADLPDGDSVLDLLTNLIDKSIITTNERQTVTRYSMLETVRQYGAEKLRQSDMENHVFDLHYQWFLKLAERAESEFSQPAQREWFERLEIELDNLRAAFERSSINSQDSAKSLRLANAQWHFWQSSGRLEEGRRWFEDALRSNGAASDELTVKALHRLGGLLVLQCDYAGAAGVYEDGLKLARRSKNEFYVARILANYGFTLVNLNEFARAEIALGEGLKIFRRLDDEKGVAQILNGLGTLAFYRDDFALAETFCSESLEIYRRIDHRLNVIGLLQNLGATAHLRGNLSDAENYLREALQISESLGERRWLNQTRHVLGYVCNDRKDYDGAIKYLTEALTLDPEIGGKDNAAHTFEGFACTAAVLQDYPRALRLIALADKLRAETKLHRSSALQKYFDKYWNAPRQFAAPEDVICAVSEANRMSFDEAIGYAVQNESLSLLITPARFS